MLRVLVGIRKCCCYPSTSFPLLTTLLERQCSHVPLCLRVLHVPRIFLAYLMIAALLRVAPLRLRAIPGPGATVALGAVLGPETTPEELTTQAKRATTGLGVSLGPEALQAQETTPELPHYRHLLVVLARVHVPVRVTYATTVSTDGSVHRLSHPRCRLPVGTDGHVITALADGSASRRQLPLPRPLPQIPPRRVLLGMPLLEALSWRSPLLQHSL